MIRPAKARWTTALRFGWLAIAIGWLLVLIATDVPAWTLAVWIAAGLPLVSGKAGPR